MKNNRWEMGNDKFVIGHFTLVICYLEEGAGASYLPYPETTYQLMTSLESAYQLYQGIPGTFSLSMRVTQRLLAHRNVHSPRSVTANS